jgi:hypothetical protein
MFSILNAEYCNNIPDYILLVVVQNEVSGGVQSHGEPVLP